jgi:glucose-1-phosphate thymidylyltransferase
MRGIVLAGGEGTRLRPLTLATSKQLLPVYDKPLVFYPLSVLLLAGIREILVISDPDHLPCFEKVLGDGAELGVSLSYAEQTAPRGLADALRIGADFIGDDSVTLILGDNIFYGHDLPGVMRQEIEKLNGATVFGHHVADPRRYGVAVLDPVTGGLADIEEKPAQPRSNVAITGLYMYDNDAVGYARELQPSARGELEITDLNRRFIEEERAKLVTLGRGYTWLDAGTPDSLLEAGKFVQTLQARQGIQVACLEEVAYRSGLIGDRQLTRLIEAAGPDSILGQYLAEVARG